MEDKNIHVYLLKSDGRECYGVKLNETDSEKSLSIAYIGHLQEEPDIEGAKWTDYKITKDVPEFDDFEAVADVFGKNQRGFSNYNFDEYLGTLDEYKETTKNLKVEGYLFPECTGSSIYVTYKGEELEFDVEEVYTDLYETWDSVSFRDFVYEIENSFDERMSDRDEKYLKIMLKPIYEEESLRDHDFDYERD